MCGAVPVTVKEVIGNADWTAIQALDTSESGGSNPVAQAIVELVLVTGSGAENVLDEVTIAEPMDADAFLRGRPCLHLDLSLRQNWPSRALRAR